MAAGGARGSAATQRRSRTLRARAARGDPGEREGAAARQAVSSLATAPPGGPQYAVATVSCRNRGIRGALVSAYRNPMPFVGYIRGMSL